MLSGEARFQMRKGRIRKRLFKYTRKAFRKLPQLDKPRVLDVGCGSGVPTMELARLSSGEIIGLDINQGLLDVLVRKIQKAGVSDRVKAIKCSIFDMEFPDESFDIIWAEGSISVIGFKRGLQEWKRFLKPNGFIVVHDEKGNIEEKLKQISSCGYELLGHFILNEDTWWAEYFAPLEKLIYETRTTDTDDQKVLEALHSSQREIDMFKKNPQLNSSVFFIMKKSCQNLVEILLLEEKDKMYLVQKLYDEACKIRKTIEELEEALDPLILRSMILVSPRCKLCPA